MLSASFLNIKLSDLYFSLHHLLKNILAPQLLTLTAIWCWLRRFIKVSASSNSENSFLLLLEIRWKPALIFTKTLDFQAINVKQQAERR